MHFAPDSFQKDNVSSVFTSFRYAIVHRSFSSQVNIIPRIFSLVPSTSINTMNGDSNIVPLYSWHHHNRFSSSCKSVGSVSENLLFPLLNCIMSCFSMLSHSQLEGWATGSGLMLLGGWLAIIGSTLVSRWGTGGDTMLDGGWGAGGGPTWVGEGDQQELPQRWSMGEAQTVVQYW